MSSLNARNDNRHYFFTAWKKFNDHETLDPLEKQIVDVIINHPEYQYFLDDPQQYLEKEFKAEQEEINPFMHFALHMSIADLLKNDEPKGICKLYTKIAHITGDNHVTDHYFMELLTLEMHDAFNERRPLDIHAIFKGAENLLQKLK